MVFFMKDKINTKIEKILLGFASGVMIAASVWSLLMPAINMADEQGIIAWFPAGFGFLLGIFFLLIINKAVTHIDMKGKGFKAGESKFRKTAMMVLAITLHNIPEGMAVGVLFAGATAQNSLVSMAGAYALAIGIGIQNIPEGAIISMPLRSEGMSKNKAFLYGMLSGVVEPIGAVITIALTNTIVVVLPYLLSFAAGAMIYVVVEELIPESQKDKNIGINIGTIGTAFGFIVMMILDVALG